MFYIGVGHKARQGKNTVVEHIHARYPKTTAILAFADALKYYCRVEYGMTTKDPALLQDTGLRFRTEVNENCWIDVLRATAYDSGKNVILVPDVRFPNEADFINRHGMLIKVTRVTRNGVFVADDRDPNHISETALDAYDKWDHILNASSVDSLEGQVDEVLEDNPLLCRILAGELAVTHA